MSTLYCSTTYLMQYYVMLGFSVQSKLYIGVAKLKNMAVKVWKLSEKNYTLCIFKLFFIKFKI